ncbi:hypothetical protein [Chenggangzhangella methanolivorans]|uniref:Uncharacterized protein n=1 Tax=Chenggangzhangella methanolivorans TaxID=1437009 RepID=A0A9E6UMA1_9HYPH|nr:hypothetical protein [Chenggangzhangella methanolivorans]QZO01457.1 hypothetical protein K6K41_08470 [Chenggangzhangella methanolivorans]
METIEPNVVALAWFALFSVVASLGFYVVAGVFPLDTRPDLTGRPARLALAFAAALAFAGLAIATGLYGYENLRWTSLVIVAGLALLFAPGLYNAWPSRWRDGPAGLALTLAGALVALVALRAIA